MSTTITTFHKVRFDVDNEFELHKEGLDKERWKEQKAAKVCSCRKETLLECVPLN